jgi:hypothetical protein
VSSSADGLQVVAVAVILGGGMLFNAIKRHRRVRHIQDTPRSRIAAAAQGFTEFEGFAWPKAEVIKTVSDEEAVYYEFQLQREESRGSGKNRRTEWVTVYSESHVNPFFIIDPTGIAVIDPAVGEVNLCDSKNKNFNSLNDKEKANVLARVGDSITGFPPTKGFFGAFSANFRIGEKTILIGSPLYATGEFHAGYQAASILIDGGLVSFTKKVIDKENKRYRDIRNVIGKSHNGKISGQTAIRCYSAAARVARLNPTKEEHQLPVHGVLLTTENHKLFFADRHEELLISDLAGGNYLRVGGGALLITVGIMFALYQVFGAGAFEWKKKAVQETSSSVTDNSSRQFINELHTGCVGGKASQCEILLHNKDKYGLTTEYVEYYQKRSCQLGGICPAKNF